MTSTSPTLSVPEAAARLGVVQRRLDAMIAHGQISAETPDRPHAASVARRELTDIHRALEWRPTLAWPALRMLSGDMRPQGTAYRTRDTVDFAFMRTAITARALVSLVAWRSPVHYFTAPSGDSLDAGFELLPVDTGAGRFIGYLTTGESIESFATRHRLVADPSGGWVIRTADPKEWGGGELPAAARAVDQAVSDVASVREHGYEWLERMLTGYRTESERLRIEREKAARARRAAIRR